MISKIIIDTNLLLLLVVGTTRRSYIAVHKRLRAYSEPDFELLLGIVERADSVIVTPNTLTETSNLLGYIAEPARTEVYKTLGIIIKASEEQYCPSSKAADSPVFLRLGLTDAVLAGVCNESCKLITADLGLYLATLENGGKATNFNHLRERWGTV